MSRLLLALAGLALALAGCGGGHHGAGTPAQRPAATPPPAGDPMTHVRALARIADAHDGTRAAGTAGDAATADYIAARLRAAGLSVRRQRFRVTVSVVLGTPVVEAGGKRLDAVPMQFTGSGHVRGRLRKVAGLGCRAADYRSLRRGEIALVRRGRCYFRVKVLLAQRAGAAALLVRVARPLSATLVRPGIRIPALSVGRDAPSSGSVHVAVRATSGRRSTANVIGELGSSGRLLMAGAHLDSVPAGPGINDDGSGVAAVLALAERFAEHPLAGARLRVGFWAAEEIGLVGSSRYVRGLSRAQRRAISAYVNLDMVASPHPKRLVYGDRAVVRVLRRHLAGARLTSIGANSDHAPFEFAGVPVGGLFTGEKRSEDPCYHRACDGLGNVDEAMLHTMTDAAEGALRELAR
jgi:Iap family predicted aminopeptidase